MPQKILCQHCNHAIYIDGGHDCLIYTPDFIGYCKLAEAVVQAAFFTINTTHFYEDMYKLTDIIKWATKDEYIIPAYAQIFDKAEDKVRNALIRRAQEKIDRLIP